MPDPGQPTSRASVDGATTYAPGDRVQHYEIVRAVATGGMGEVYEARQEQPVRRRVALKVTRAGMSSDQVVVRFASERQALALMDHPGIAQVFDAGVTERGQPYFAMEFVDGLPITEFCDAHGLGTKARLRLIAQACDALQHAHHKGVIHRDVKPSNVLVRELDGEPVAKVIDFGVAKAIAEPLTDDLQVTQAGQLLGTPMYMSPEQASLGAGDIDTRSDVYALGVLMYEVLVGGLPFDDLGIGLRDVLRRISEDEPPPPSARLTQLDRATTAQTAASRGVAFAALRRELAGDLDWIALKALEKDRERRYPSAAELAADIRRHLAHEPVLARPPSVAYRLRKLARRHKAATAGIAAVLVSLVAGVVVSTAAWIQAERQASIARAVNAFLTDDLLAAVDPSNTADRDVTMRAVLDEAAARVRGRFGNEPLVAAAIRRALGRTYLGLGEYDAAEPHLQAALDLRRAHGGGTQRDSLESMADVALLRFHQGRYDDAEELFGEALAAQEHELGAADPLTLGTRSALATVHIDQDRLDRAEQLLVEAEALADQELGDEHIVTLEIRNNLALLYGDQERFAEAEKLYDDVLAAQRRGLGDEHPATLTSSSNLAWLYYGQGRTEEAVQLGAATLEAQRRVLGDEHKDTLNSVNNVAVFYRNLGRNDLAEPLYREDLEASTRLFGEEHPGTLVSMFNLGRLYNDDGRFADAEEILSRSAALSKQVLGLEHYGTAMQTLAYGEALAGGGKHRDAEPVLLEAHRLLTERFAPDFPAVVRAGQLLAISYEALGDAEAADRWRARRRP